jgi:DNA (cytosine-5)-methyltransferase 1
MSIRELRYNNGLTIDELSKQLGLDIKRVRVLDRQLDSPNEDEIGVLSSFFNVSIDDISKSIDKNKNIIGEGYVTSKGENVTKILAPKKNTTLDNRIPVLDLFCGIGGLSYGFEQTGSFVTIAGIDLMDDRIDTFQANHPHAIGVISDIRKLKPAKLADVLPTPPKVIVGGAPCQGFSSIRPFRTLSEDDERNNLFKHFGNYVDYFKPEWFVFENVVGLLTHKGGSTLNILIDEFESLGYSVSFRILNSAYFGVPQIRERLIIVGNRLNKIFSWPKPTHYLDNFKSMAGKRTDFVINPELKEECKKAVSVIDAISDLEQIEAGQSATNYISKPQNDYQKYLREKTKVVSNHTASVHSEKMMEIIKQSGFNINAVKHLVTSGFSSCYSRLEPNKPSVTLTVNFTHPSSNKCIHPNQNRALTPREGARLQGFPDHFIFLGTKTQIVKQIGNAVPPILSKVIAEKIIDLQ